MTSFSSFAHPKIFSRLEWMVQWFKAHESLITWLGIASVIMFVGTLIAIPLILIYLPSDHFSDRPHQKTNKGSRSFLVQPLLLAAKNLLGAVFFLTGLAMLILPGQGVIAILVGLSLLSIPGKRRILLRILRQPNVKGTINWMRSKGRKPPLEIPQGGHTG